MAIDNCRGRERKRAIVERYVLRPVVHAKLIDGQEIDGCCGRVTDRYYFFEAKPRDGGKTEAFHVGYDCAEQFLGLIDHPLLPLFNPLHEDGVGHPRGAGAEARAAEPPMDPLNRELLNAIHIVFLSWRSFLPDSPLSQVLIEIRRNPGKAVPARV